MKKKIRIADVLTGMKRGTSRIRFRRRSIEAQKLIMIFI